MFSYLLDSNKIGLVDVVPETNQIQAGFASAARGLVFTLAFMGKARYLVYFFDFPVAEGPTA